MTCSRCWRAVLFVIWPCAAIGLAGCTPAPVEVSGTIKLKGQAPNVKGLEISFLHPDGRTASAPINADGTYSAAEVPVGEVKICFVYFSPESAVKKGPRQLPKNIGDPPTDDGPKGKEVASPIPLNLREAATSKLIFNVVARQKNTFDYDIKP